MGRNHRKNPHQGEETSLVRKLRKLVRSQRNTIKQLRKQLGHDPVVSTEDEVEPMVEAAPETMEPERCPACASTTSLMKLGTRRYRICDWCNWRVRL